ncbi:efflux RND transporter periplasmic adaptor subunit [bacterium]|nr:MAG: efflux RND transporter periplasmic adaptor subunit [bacterium]
MIRYLVLLLSVLMGAAPTWAADSPSVQVQTVALTQQTMTDTVSGYGMVSPDTRALHTLSLPRAGQVVALLVSAGQTVKKGMPLLEFGTSAESTLSYQQARQAVDFAKSEEARVGELASQQLATQSQLANARKTLADAEAALRTQEKIGANRASEQLVAPFDGVVMAIQAAQGDRVAAGAPVMQLARAGGQRVLVGVEPDEVARVRLGMSVSIAPVFGVGHQSMGRVTQVFGMVNPQTQFVDVLVQLPDAALIPGTRVHAEIQLDQQTGWTVPRSAVLSDAQGSYIFQVHDGKAHRVNVKAGLEHGGQVLVQGGFASGEPVVSLGNYELRDGMAVRGSAR